jgi:arylsulfatase A-like enzyme
VSQRAHGSICALLLLLGCGRGPNDFNLLLISIDTLRADHLSAYGYPRETSPHIEALAREGIRFANVHSQRAGTWPALTSLLTSLHPRTHGVRANGQILGPDRRNLAEMLLDQGYATAAFLTNMTTAPNRGFHLKQGFRGSRRRDEEATRAAIRWLGERPASKFFLWVHLMGPHEPYAPDPPYDTLFGPGYAGDLDGTRRTADRIHEQRRELSAVELDHIVSLYDGAIAQMDARVGRILAALDEEGLGEQTLVVLTSDHGEELYDHNYYLLHSWSIYRSVLHVPLIMRLPGVLPEGETLEAVVALLDVVPTILELMALPAPENLEGTSLVPRIRGLGSSPEAPGESIAELGPHIFAIRTDRWHYLYNPKQLSSPGARPSDDGQGGRFRIAREELYDVIADPGETRNLISEQPQVAAELRQRLLQWQGGEGGDYSALPIPEESQEELRALGYLQ